MSMTRLEWRYLQKIALDHPYFDTHELPLTEKEAKAIVKANIKMTGREFVDSIYAKLGMTRPEEKKDRFAKLRSIGELFTVPPIRKIAIAVLVIILMAVFFAATPTGRAIAESVIQYVVTLFDDGKLIMNRNDTEVQTYVVPDDGFIGSDLQDPKDITAHVAKVNTVQEFIEATGKTPIVLPISYSDLYYEYDDELEYLEFVALYSTADGEIVTYQISNTDYLESVSSTGFLKYDEEDDSVYYSVEEEEGRFHCQIILKDSIITVTSEVGYTMDDIVRMLKD